MTLWTEYNQFSYNPILLLYYDFTGIPLITNKYCMHIYDPICSVCEWNKSYVLVSLPRGLPALNVVTPCSRNISIYWRVLVTYNTYGIHIFSVFEGWAVSSVYGIWSIRYFFLLMYINNVVCLPTIVLHSLSCVCSHHCAYDPAPLAETKMTRDGMCVILCIIRKLVFSDSFLW